MRGSDNDPGIVIHSLKNIFTELGKERGCFCRLKISYFEVYNEKINDLLNSDNQNLDIKLSKKGEIYVQNLTEIEVSTPKSAIKHYLEGEGQRKYAATNMNHNSSRSHVVLKLKIETRYKHQPHKSYFSTLMMADLAGSECIGNTKTTGDAQREGKLINKSLLSLSNVIKKLAKNKKDGFISFRESKLTRIFQPVLSGNSRTLVICTVNPTTKHLNESMNTIRFGMKAGDIKIEMKPQSVNLIPDEKQIEKIDKLSQEYEVLMEKVESQDKIIRELEEKVESLEDDIEYRDKKIDLMLENEALLQEDFQDLTNDYNELVEILESNFKKRFEIEFLEFKMEYLKKTGLVIPELNNLIKENEMLHKQQFEEMLAKKIYEDENYVKNLVNEISRTKHFKDTGVMEEEGVVSSKKSKRVMKKITKRNVTKSSKKMTALSMGLSKRPKEGQSHLEKDIEICKLRDLVSKLRKENRDLKFDEEMENKLNSKSHKRFKPNTPRSAIRVNKWDKLKSERKVVIEENKENQIIEPPRESNEENEIESKIQMRRKAITPSKTELKKKLKEAKIKSKKKGRLLDKYDKEVKLLRREVARKEEELSKKASDGFFGAGFEEKMREIDRL